MSFLLTEQLRKTLSVSLTRFERRALEGGVSTLKHAAVAITIVDMVADLGEAGFLLTRRAETLRGHAGQWALPGGRCDPGETAIEAALRELHEELGIQATVADVLGTLDDYPTRSGYRVTPIVVWMREATGIQPNPAEVASVYRIPLADVAHPDAVSFVSIAESEKRVVRLRIAGTYVHAPTAAILYQFGELLNGRRTHVADLEQPVFAWR